MSIPEVGLEQLEDALSGGRLVVDVRQTEEYADGHVPGAVNIPLHLVPLRLDELRGQGPVHVICQSGGRSAHAVQVLARSGVDAVSVAPGTGGWLRAGRPVVTGRSPR